MSHKEENNISRDEIKKEFQLERMILFSDAVFAIVITLMAIEIRMPEGVDKISTDTIPHLARHLFPTILAYAVSFGFIGSIWYNHLQIFSVLKDYDSGLVVRNLVLLFFIGLFPFCATVIARSKGSGLASVIYFAIIFICMTVQYFLQRYILVKKPNLRVQSGIETHLEELKKKKELLIMFGSIAGLILITWILITPEEMKPLAMLLMFLFPVIKKRLDKKRATAKNKKRVLKSD